MENQKILITGLGTLLAWLGIISNNLVMYLNNGMPFPGVYAVDYPTGFGKYVPITGETHLVGLSDIIQVPGGLASIGDVFLITGMILVSIGGAYYIDVFIKRLVQIRLQDKFIRGNQD